MNSTLTITMSRKNINKFITDKLCDEVVGYNSNVKDTILETYENGAIQLKIELEDNPDETETNY